MRRIKVCNLVFVAVLIIVIIIMSLDVRAAGDDNNPAYYKMCASSGVHQVVSERIDRMIDSVLYPYGSTNTRFARAAQQRLYDLDYIDRDGVDGRWGNASSMAIANFQMCSGITADGVLGPKTWRYLLSDDAERYNPDAVYKHINESEVSYTGNTYDTETARSGVYFAGSYIGEYITGDEFMGYGNVVFDGMHWTYYSQRVLPGGGLSIPGRHVDPYGFVVDEDGYICLAIPAGATHEVFQTPFGRLGKAYDCCPEGNMDVYVDW